MNPSRGEASKRSEATGDMALMGTVELGSSCSLSLSGTTGLDNCFIMCSCEDVQLKTGPKQQNRLAWTGTFKTVNSNKTFLFKLFLSDIMLQ